jgi:hypothetical protein
MDLPPARLHVAGVTARGGPRKSTFGTTDRRAIQARCGDAWNAFWVMPFDEATRRQKRFCVHPLMAEAGKSPARPRPEPDPELSMEPKPSGQIGAFRFGSIADRDDG